MSKKAEPKWHPASEKPTGKHDSFVVLVACEGQYYIYFDCIYDEDDGFEFWEDQGYEGCWWSSIKEVIVGWMRQEDLEKYLISLHNE